MKTDAEVLREALEIVKKRPSTALSRGIQTSLTFAIADHENPEDDEACTGGDSCVPLKMARQVIAGEL